MVNGLPRINGYRDIFAVHLIHVYTVSSVEIPCMNHLNIERRRHAMNDDTCWDGIMNIYNNLLFISMMTKLHTLAHYS